MAVLIKLELIKIWKGYKAIALEMAALLFMASVLMTYLLTQDFLIGRICRVNLGYSKELCLAVIQNIGNHTTEESSVQTVMTELRKTSSIINYSIPIVFVVLQGSWSDIYGRKMPLMLPCIGFILQALSLFLCTYFESWDGYSVMLISTIPKCLAGSDVTFRMAAQSYISDISTMSKRTVRTGLISAAFTLGVPMGFALGGAAVKASIKSEIAFLCSAAICAVALIQILLFVDNRPKFGTDQQVKIKNPVDDSNNVKNGEKKWLTLSNLMSVLRSLILSFDGVSTSARIQIFVLITAIVCINAPIQGEFGVMYLYLRKKLLWDSGDYGIFSTYVSLVGVTGTVISMGVLCSVLKLMDPVVGFIAGISQFAGSFMYAFAYNNVMIYLAPAIDMLNGTMSVVAKSMLSKMCPPEDFGKMFSFLAVIELLVPLVFDPTYSTIYQHTMDTFPGSVFLLSALMTVPPQLIYIFYIWKNRHSASCDITKTDQCDTNYESNASRGNNTSKYLQTYCSSGRVEEPASRPVTLKSACSTIAVVETKHLTNNY